MLELKQVLELIHAIQAKLSAEGTSIDNIILLVIALFVLMTVGYLVELQNSEKGD